MRKLLQFLLWTAIAAGVLIGVARAFALRWWRIPDNDPFLDASINPTLRGGELVILWRLSKPGYGDLVLCPEPNAPERVVIGRVAGEANDQIKFHDTSVSINGRFPSTERGCGAFVSKDPNTGAEVPQRCEEEVLGSGGHMRGTGDGNKGKPSKVEPDKEYKVPANHWFLLSDNRLFPYDSRDFGTVDQQSCKETILFRLVGKEGFSDEKSRFTFIH